MGKPIAKTIITALDGSDDPNSRIILEAYMDEEEHDKLTLDAVKALRDKGYLKILIEVD